MDGHSHPTCADTVGRAILGKGMRSTSCATISDAKLVVIDDAHHSPQIEASGAWLETICAHLERAR